MNRLGDLMTFLRFPSISAQSGHSTDMLECAEWLAAKFRGMNFEATIYPTAKHPVLVAKGPEAPGKPRVLIYGHYDVQPIDPLELWLSDPFEPELRDGKIFARGATDNKGQILAHILGVEELMNQEGGHLPVNVTFILDGEEEIGSHSLYGFLQEHKEMLACDVIVVSDTGMVAPGVPTFTYGLRGVACAQVDVVGPAMDLHSGIFGGAAPNPARVLAELISSCYDASGKVAVAGFYDDVVPLESWERVMWSTVPGMDDAALCAVMGVPALIKEEGYTGAECIYARPTLEVNGLSSGYQGEGSKTIVPSRAMAKISCRLVPGQDPDKILDLVVAHFLRMAPLGVEVRVTKQHGGSSYRCDPHSPYGKAAQQALEQTFGRKPVLVREGGSIPIVQEMHRVLGVDALLLGMCLPDACIHSPNENFPVELFEKGIELSQTLLRRLGEAQ